MIKKKSTLTVPKLKKKLDRLFSKYIKLRDGGQDYFKCISCSRTKPLNQLKKYGKEILQHLEIKKNNISNLGKFELSVLIDEYKDKIKGQERLNLKK